MAHILIVDDEEKMRYLLSIMLERRGHLVEQAGDGAEALEKIRATAFDLVITDIKMPRMDGNELLSKIAEMDMPCPVVIITAFATVESAVETMKMGAADYITKPFEEERILLTVERTLSLSKILAENRDLKRELEKVAGGGEIVYGSKEMSQVIGLASKVAKSDAAVMISGESGTGKELLARYIHHNSPRKEGRFVPVNCAAISPNLVESELFGHEKGAFTGAIKRVMGKFEYATGGTLFLDEIGDLSLEAQAKLLRALQEKKVQRVGGNDEITVDARIICATNQDLNELVKTGEFRQDLLFRINVFPILPPPLRERKDDVPLLAAYFLRRFGDGSVVRLTEGAKRVLREYSWPGNVRELANAIERSLILAHGQGVITAETLSFLRAPAQANNDEGLFRLPPGGIALEEVEKNLVMQALESSGYNQTNAARLLGLSRGKFRVIARQIKKRSKADD